ncbi:MAG TPA: glutamate--tRNA ligase family protein [Chthoniobacterales bacterium]|jgi:glutamyl-tRNA synthetase|nr:glutamate--tRNA ligase family protein [Chthoniobacterales bacterium]
MSSAVRVRFAPSPTGFLHIGGARTALFNWLYAHHTGGTLILRIEDTDEARNTAAAIQAIYDGLRWLGLEWDEGPQAGGNFGPYFQSERNDIYERHLARLEAGGHLFEENGAIRFRSPREHVVVDDVVCGKIDFDLTNPETHPDMTIRRPDGSWIFHFVNVVDDLEMKISHVIRGEDHLSNTPKHIELYRALGAEPPRFAHIPLILNQDGSKMSKRDVGSSLNTYIEEGFLPEAVRNYLCLLGWSPKDNREKIELKEVVRLFELEKIHRKNASFDLAKCTWLNGEYVRELPEARFHALAEIALTKAGLDPGKFPTEYVRAALDTCKGKFRIFSELPAYCGFYFTDQISYQPEGLAKHFVPENKPRLQALRDAFATLENFDAPSLEAALKATAAELGVKLGALVHPTRLAVTGSNAGPSLYHLLEILGRGRVLARIDAALKMFPV